MWNPVVNTENNSNLTTNSNLSFFKNNFNDNLNENQDIIVLPTVNNQFTKPTLGEKFSTSIYEKEKLRNMNKLSFNNDPSNHKLAWRRLQLSRSKLKQTAKTSALFSGFAMVAMVELNFNNDPSNPIPLYLLILFGICTILLVGVHILALMIATCILPSVEAIALLECVKSASESPHERLKFFIELAWTLSSVIGVFLFLLEVIIVFWVKFWEIGQPSGLPGKIAAFVNTFVFIPIVIIFIFFAIYFYRDFAKNKYEKSNKEIQELENMIDKLEKADYSRFFYSSQKLNKLSGFTSLHQNQLNPSNNYKIKSNNFYNKVNLMKKNSKKKLNNLFTRKQLQSKVIKDNFYFNPPDFKLNHQKSNSSLRKKINFSLDNFNYDQEKIISPKLSQKLAQVSH